MATVLILFLGFIFVLVVMLWLISPGHPEAFRDDQGNILKGGSLSEKVFVSIGGVQQGMFIKSRNLGNPVLLYVHGGPAFPNYFLIEKFKPGLEDYFTVCYWEQRGGGLSYSPGMDIKSMTLEQLTSDAIEVSHYLCKRFGKEKIFILAHSGGTPIALSAVKRAPELFCAYIAMAQISNQSESEKRALEFMQKEFTARKDHRALEALAEFNGLQDPSDALAFHQSMIRDKYMHALGIGTMRNMKSIVWDIFIPSWECRAYTLEEKINIWRSKFSFLHKTNLQTEIMAANYPESIPGIEVPVFFISGKYDLTVNIDLSFDYFERLEAPYKRFFVFEHSAHSPLFEESGRFREILDHEILPAIEKTASHRQE